MSESAKPFIKADSIVALRHKHAAADETMARIRALRDSVPAAGGYRDGIVRRAITDLLAERPTPDSFYLRPHVVEELRRLTDAELPRYLFYRYRYDMFPLLKELDRYPPCVQVEAASICNYRCVFCYQIDSEFTRPKAGHMGLMQLDTFKRVIDQLQGEVEAVTIASRGEPLINPAVADMLRYAAGKFLALKINTNAWYLDEAKAHAILSADVNTLVFSADAAEEPLYSRLRVNGKLDRIVANIDLFNRVRREHYPQSRLITRVSGVRYSAAQNEADMERFWGDRVDQVAFVDYNPWENTYERDVSGIDAPCSDLWRRMFVWWNGIANPCDVDYKSTLTVGALAQQDIAALWRGERYTELRTAHLATARHSLFPCNRCTVV